ncbi:hypothetical protein E9993_09910 [Labilibacter sediminis]|nr:hypothetical protein E9993_09910 [Labilibacter sediminis]
MISVKHKQDSGIVEILIKKDATSHEFIQLCKCIEEEKTFSRHLNIIIKAAEGFKNINTSHLFVISDAVRRFLKKYDKTNIAFIVSHKRELELSLIFKDLIKYNFYQFHVFQNTKDALRWLRRSNQPSQPSHTPLNKKAG